MKLTKAQMAILRWLRDHHRLNSERISGGTLIDYYANRYLKDHPDFDPNWGLGTNRRHAWRRTGGLQLRRLQEAGALYLSEFHWGVPQYAFTEAGKLALMEADHKEALESSA